MTALKGEIGEALLKFLIIVYLINTHTSCPKIAREESLVLIGTPPAHLTRLRETYSQLEKEDLLACMKCFYAYHKLIVDSGKGV